MINPKTYDRIAGWAKDKYAAQAPSLLGAGSTTTAAPSAGMLGAGTASATAAPSPWAAATTAPPSPLPQEVSITAAATAKPQDAMAPIPTPATPTPLLTKPNVDVGDWYKQHLGREADPAGRDYWQKAIDAGMDQDQAFQMFQKSAAAERSGPKPSLENGPAQINPFTLAQRVIDPATETVRGQLSSILADDSPVLQQARADAMRNAADRGMLNSAMAASGGTDAMIRSALNIATPDAGYFNNAADYNVAAKNQATMWNAEQQNDFAKAQMQVEADALARGQQMTLAQMQDATNRWTTEQNTANSRFNTDADYRQQVEGNKKTLVNNIIANMDLSPDRKAAMLEQLGEGTSAQRAPDGTIVPGTGLAGAVFVIDSISADLQFGPNKVGNQVREE